MSVVFLKSHRDELIEGVLHLILAPTKAELPIGTTTQEARQEIEKICSDYLTNLEETKDSPSIKEVRDALKKSAAGAAALATQFRQDANKLKFGTATFKPTDSPEVTQAKRNEIELFKTELLNEAAVLDQFAKRLFARRDQWAGKNTGDLRSDGFVFGPPSTQLAIAAGRIFTQHRLVNDFHASPTGDFYVLVRLLFEIATGNKPKETELLSAVRDAVAALKSQ